MAATGTNLGLIDYQGDDPSSFGSVVVSDDELLISPPPSSPRERWFAFACSVVLTFFGITIGIGYGRDNRHPGFAEISVGAAFSMLGLYSLAWSIRTARYWRAHGSTRPTYTFRRDAVIETTPGLFRLRPRKWLVDKGRTVRWKFLPTGSNAGWNLHVWTEPVNGRSLMFDVPLRRRLEVEHLGNALRHFYPLSPDE